MVLQHATAWQMHLVVQWHGLLARVVHLQVVYLLAAHLLAAHILAVLLLAVCLLAAVHSGVQHVVPFHRGYGVLHHLPLLTVSVNKLV